MAGTANTVATGVEQPRDTTRPPPTHERRGPPSPPPLTGEDAERFIRLRSLAIKTMLDFMEEEIDPYKPGAEKLKLKKLEIAQAVASLGGRIDPAALRGEKNDETEELLKVLRGNA